MENAPRANGARTGRASRVAVLTALAAAAAVATFWYFATSFPVDIRANLGAAHQAMYHGGWPYGVVEAWDLRGLGYKAIAYWLDQGGQALSGEYATRAYEVAVKGIYAVAMAVAVTATALLIRLRGVAGGWSRTAVGLLLWTAVATVSSTAAALQAETTAALVGLVALALVTREEWWAHPAAGVLAAAVVSLKGVTVVTGVIGVVAGLALVRTRVWTRIWRSVAGFAVTMAGMVAVLLLVVPRELEDLRNATLYQNSFSDRTLDNRLAAVERALVDNWFHVPVVALSMLAIVAVLLWPRVGAPWLGARHWRAVGLAPVWLATAVALGVALIAVQARGFPYHQAALIPAAVAALLALVAARRDLVAIRRPAWTAVSAAVVGAALVVPTLVPVGGEDAKPGSSPVAAAEYAAEAPAWQALRDAARERCTGEVLYLDDGRGAYHLGMESWLRYTYPLPIQRRLRYLHETDVFRDALARAESFAGDCIVWQDTWLWEERQPWVGDLLARIEAEYRQVDVGLPLSLWVRAGA